MKITRKQLREMVRDVLKEEYIEVMGPDFDKGVDLISKAWKEWKAGPETEGRHINPAKKEILRWIERNLK